MTLEEIYYFGQTVAVIIIIATLVAVLFQVRQANRLAQLETTRAVWMDFGARLGSNVDNSEKAEFLQRALYENGELTTAEKTRFYLVLASMFVSFETGFAMHKSGMMNARFWPHMRDSLRDFVAPQRAQRWWALARKRSFSSYPEFVAEVDAVIVDINEKANG